MPDTYSIGTPYSLLSVPRSVDVSENAIRTGLSYSVEGSKKRKRSEIVVAADGDSVGLYSVKHPRLITSHPVQPSSSFTAPPICCRVHTKDRKGTARLIYAAVRSNVGKSKNEILCVHEDVVRSSSSVPITTHQQRKSVTSLGSEDDPLVFTDIIPSKDTVTDDSIDVIAIQRKGHIVCLSQDLDRQHWTNNLAESLRHADQVEPMSDLIVDHAFILDSETASSGILKTRPDISGVWQQNSEDRTKYFKSILCLVTHDTSPKSGHKFSIFAIHSRASVPNQQSALQLLSTCILPTHDVFKSSGDPRMTFQFDERSGRLQHLISNSIFTYSFEDTKPKVFSRLNLIGEPLSSFVPLGDNAVLVNSPNSISIYNTRYHSLQASQSSFIVGQSRKPKRIQQGPRGDNLQIATYYADLGLAIGLSGEYLIALEIRKSGLDGSRYPQGSLLVNSFGKATGTKSILSSEEGLNENPELTRSEAELNRLVNLNDVSAFERRFSEVVGLDLWKETMAASEPRRAQDDNKSARHRTHETSQAITAKSLYALNKIFAWNTNRGRPMTLTERPSIIYIKFCTSKVLKWLNLEGYLTPSSIEQALRLRNTLPSNPGVIKYIDVINAISNVDQSLVLLSESIMTSPYIPLHGILNGLSVLLQSFCGPSETPTLDNRLLADGDSTAGQPSSKGNPETSQDLELLAAEEVVMQDIALVNNILESGPFQRQAALADCLEKLSTRYRVDELAQSMRTHLPRQEVVLLVQFLRHELSKGGWKDVYLDVSPVYNQEELESPDAGTLLAICTLLNAALDALGSGGWLAEQNLSKPVSNTTDVAIIDDTEAEATRDEADVIALLRDETSSILEGIQESAFFQHFLKDFLRFEDAFVDALPEPTSNTSGGKRKRRRSEALANVSNPTIRNLSVATRSQSGMLPMGVSTVQDISKKSVGLDGAVKAKSSRHVGGIKSKRVGQYSFESLEV